MEVEKLFKGIAVIVDDQINDEGSSISLIRNFLEEKDIPVLAFKDVPSTAIVESLDSAAFIILDWEYIGAQTEEIIGDERILQPDELKFEKENQLLLFIKEIVCKLFIPVFIFTALDSEKIKETLRENELWSDEHPNRIFIKQKSELASADNLFSSIEMWLKDMPSVYVLKKWEEVFTKTKNKFFLEMYGYSPNWVGIIWEALKHDSEENQQEFGDFLTRNLINRMESMSFEEEFLLGERSITVEELAAVIEGERYMVYKDTPKQAYTGDLFFKDDAYFLNIRAQCDLARRDNPELYCIKGHLLPDTEIVTEDIKVTNEGNLRFNKNTEFSLSELIEISKDQEKLDEFNNNFSEHRIGRFFTNGVILEKGPEVIIACIAGKKVIRFRMDLLIKKYNELKEYRIGRILPPYITRIQQRCSQYIVREGVMPIPDNLFDE